MQLAALPRLGGGVRLAAAPRRRRDSSPLGAPGVEALEAPGVEELVAAALPRDRANHSPAIAPAQPSNTKWLRSAITHRDTPLDRAKLQTPTLSPCLSASSKRVLRSCNAVFPMQRCHTLHTRPTAAQAQSLIVGPRSRGQRELRKGSDLGHVHGIPHQCARLAHTQASKH